MSTVRKVAVTRLARAFPRRCRNLAPGRPEIAPRQIPTTTEPTWHRFCSAREYGGYRKIDDFTVALSTKQPASYFPYMAVYILFTSPASFEKAGRDWARVAVLPAAGTGPFRLAKVVPREVAELARWDGYWDAARKAKLDTIRLLPIPEATSRVAALRSGQVDWIEVPPPDGIPSLKAAGFTLVTNSYRMSGHGCTTSARPAVRSRT